MDSCYRLIFESVSTVCLVLKKRQSWILQMLCRLLSVVVSSVALVQDKATTDKCFSAGQRLIVQHKCWQKSLSGFNTVKWRSQLIFLEF